MDLGYLYAEEVPQGFEGLEIKILGTRMDLLILKKSGSKGQKVPVSEKFLQGRDLRMKDVL